MPILKTKFEFDRWSKSVVGTAIAVINEALCGPAFRHDVTYAEHRQQIAREALTRKPELLGQLAALAATDAATAIQTATDALQELRAVDPLLFQSSRAPKSQVVAWVRRAFPHREADEIRAAVNYAMAQDAWNMRYETQHRLADQGQDIAAIADEIECASPGDQ